MTTCPHCGCDVADGREINVRRRDGRHLIEACIWAAIAAVIAAMERASPSSEWIVFALVWAFIVIFVLNAAVFALAWWMGIRR